jgi:hypothetical protein
MLLAETLNVLLTKKLGVKEDSEELKKVLTALGTSEINDDLAKQLSGLLTVNEAKNDTTVKNHFYGQFADTYDRATEKMVKALGIDDATLDEIKSGEKSSFKRIDVYQEKISEIQKKQAGSNSKKEVEQYQKEINELNKKRQDEIAHKDKAIEDLKKDFESREVDWTVESLIPRDKLNDAIPEKFRLKNAKEAISEFIQKSGAKIVKGENGLKLVRANDIALDYTDSDLKTLIEKGLAEANLYKTAAGQPDKKTVEFPKEDPKDTENAAFRTLQERINQSKQDFLKTT